MMTLELLVYMPLLNVNFIGQCAHVQEVAKMFCGIKFHAFASGHSFVKLKTHETYYLAFDLAA